MTDQELFTRFESHMKEEGWTYEQAAKIIGFEKSTIFNWKNGKPISARGRAALKVLTQTVPNNEISQFANSNIGTIQGATIVGKAGTITYGRGAKPDAMPAPVLEEKAIRLEERKRILDKLMALDSIPAEVKIIIYNELNKEN